MKNKILRVTVFAVGGASIAYTAHWGNQHAASLGQPGMLIGELAVFVAGGLAFMGMISFGNSLVKRPGPRALPRSPTTPQPDVA